MIVCQILTLLRFTTTTWHTMDDDCRYFYVICVRRIRSTIITSFFCSFIFKQSLCFLQTLLWIFIQFEKKKMFNCIFHRICILVDVLSLYYHTKQRGYCWKTPFLLLKISTIYGNNLLSPVQYTCCNLCLLVG